MTNTQLLIVVLICAGVTVMSRLISFLVFKGGKTPAFITWLGSQLPAAVMTMLLVYCLKDVSFARTGGWIPALCGVAVTALAHIWKKNMMLSICGGTVVYMVLIKLL